MLVILDKEQLFSVSIGIVIVLSEHIWFHQHFAGNEACLFFLSSLKCMHHEPCSVIVGLFWLKFKHVAAPVLRFKDTAFDATIAFFICQRLVENAKVINHPDDSRLTSMVQVSLDKHLLGLNYFSFDHSLAGF